MPALNLRDASLEDAEKRVTEIREEFISLDEGRRSDPDARDYDAAFRSITSEADTLDTFITMTASKMHAESARLAATAGPDTGRRSSGLRSIGEAIVDDDYLESGRRELPAGQGDATHRYFTNHDQTVRLDGFKQLIGQRSFGNQINQERPTPEQHAEYMAVSNWLRLAAAYGADGVRAVTEWGSGGPLNPALGFDTTDSGGMLPRLSQPIVPVPRQAKLWLRDLMASMPTTYASVPYVRELNPVAYESAASGGATTVAEGSVKPTAQLSFVSEIAPVATIAATLTISKQMMEDGPAVIAYINGRLPYLVKLAEDNQFLNGNGTWPNMLGITQTPGIQSQIHAGAGNPYIAISLGNAMADIENADGVCDAVVMNPTDAWNMFTNRAAGGSGTFDAGAPFSALPLTVWGVQTYRSRVYPAGSALVSDFQRGAMVIDRESVNVQTYNERYAEQNLALLIAEERVGIAVFRPELFVSTATT